MKAVKDAAAGSLESSDVLVTVTPAEGEENTLSVDSIVFRQFGGRIRSVAEEVIASRALRGPPWNQDREPWSALSGPGLRRHREGCRKA
jgi:citrate lyase gamma subunit